MQHIFIHFESVDPILFEALTRIGEIPPVTKKGNSADHFTELCASIISQQLSVKVADVIWTRFVHLFPEGRDWAKGETEPSLSHQRVLEVPDQQMRDQGISWAKIKYIKDLAQKVANKEIDLEQIDSLPDEEVIAELVKVKGIGRWTAEMFLMFSLARPDTFPVDDLGIKKAMAKLKLKKSDRWKPYRTVASWYLWRSLENR